MGWHSISSVFKRTDRSVIRFVVVTVMVVCALYIVLKVSWVERHFVAPYTEFVAACSRTCLGLVGVRAAGSGDMIVSPDFSVTIKNVCNGLEVMAIFVAATIGFPATITGKSLGLLIGIPLIFLLNTIRVMALFVIGSRDPQVFDDVHFYYAQALVIVATVALWLLWINTFSVYGAKTRSRLFG
jgi:exosortase H (IPTLxxWG-CTERM-specific)